MVVLLTPELKKKEEEVQKYLIGWDRFKPNTPDYIKEYYEELKEYISDVEEI